MEPEQLFENLNTLLADVWEPENGCPYQLKVQLNAHWGNHLSHIKWYGFSDEDSRNRAEQIVMAACTLVATTDYTAAVCEKTE